MCTGHGPKLKRLNLILLPPIAQESGDHQVVASLHNLFEDAARSALTYLGLLRSETLERRYIAAVPLPLIYKRTFKKRRGRKEERYDTIAHQVLIRQRGDTQDNWPGRKRAHSL